MSEPKPTWMLPPEGKHWEARRVNWPEPGEEMVRGTHSIHDEDEMVIAMTWGSERADLLASVPELVRIARVARNLVDTFPRDHASPEALTEVDKLLKEAGY